MITNAHWMSKHSELKSIAVTCLSSAIQYVTATLCARPSFYMWKFIDIPDRPRGGMDLDFSLKRYTDRKGLPHNCLPYFSAK